MTSTRFESFLDDLQHIEAKDDQLLFKFAHRFSTIEFDTLEARNQVLDILRPTFDVRLQ